MRQILFILYNRVKKRSLTLSFKEKLLSSAEMEVIESLGVNTLYVGGGGGVRSIPVRHKLRKKCKYCRKELAKIQKNLCCLKKLK